MLTNAQRGCPGVAIYGSNKKGAPKHCAFFFYTYSGRETINSPINILIFDIHSSASCDLHTRTSVPCRIMDKD